MPQINDIDTMQRMIKVALIYNTLKPMVVEALKTFEPWLQERADIVLRQSAPCEAFTDRPDADVVIILGGDGTMIAQARSIVDWNIPVIGVNFGKIGFITEFNMNELQAYWPEIIARQYIISERVMLHGTICTQTDDGNGGHEETCFNSLAMNDFVITAGEPFRMLELKMTVDPSTWTKSATRFQGDGVIIATPTGSTAYNLSAGGPILAPDVHAFSVTPICPYSLSFRPVVINASDEVKITLDRSNPGTMLVIDGQNSYKLPEGSKLVVHIHKNRFKLIRNPGNSYWKMLARKLKWAERPDNPE